MPNNSAKLRVNVVIEVSADALQSVVANFKRVADRNANGVCHVDTADKLGEMISRFLDEHDFESFVNNPDIYNKS